MGKSFQGTCQKCHDPKIVQPRTVKGKLIDICSNCYKNETCTCICATCPPGTPEKVCKYKNHDGPGRICEKCKMSRTRLQAIPVSVGKLEPPVENLIFDKRMIRNRPPAEIIAFG